MCQNDATLPGRLREAEEQLRATMTNLSRVSRDLLTAEEKLAELGYYLCPSCGCYSHDLDLAIYTACPAMGACPNCQTISDLDRQASRGL